MATPVSEATADSSPSSATRARGRGRGNRGGLGKYLRARGRRGAGRPAVFNERLVLDGEGSQELEEEEARERELKYSRRQLGTNADRYVEPEPEIGSDGEEVVEPEVDISKFLERQRLDDASGPSAPPPDEEDSDVDESLAHLTAKSPTEGSSRKGKVQQIEWNQELEDMRREKAVAQAHWDLKERFRARVDQQRGRGAARARAPTRSTRKQDKSYIEAPPLPTDPAVPAKSAKAEMEDYLDDLLG